MDEDRKEEAMSSGSKSPGSKFIAVGENIHCTRIFKVGGKYVNSEGGSWRIVYEDRGKERILPVPSFYLEGEDWKNGKVKHAAVGIWQGMNGADESARKAGQVYLQYMARIQEENKASFLDLNVDEYGADVNERIEAIRWAAQVMQGASALPLSIDSSNVEILKAGLSACDQSRDKSMVNSVSLERPTAIQIAKDAGAVVIAGASSPTGMPSTKAERLENLEVLTGKLREEGLTESDIYFDPLIFPISVDSGNGKAVFDTIRELRQRYGPGVHFAPGLSNISFGMPNRKLLNQVFTYLCREEGLDGGIVDPLQINQEILDSLDPESKPFVMARDVLTGGDEFGMNYIMACRDGKL